MRESFYWWFNHYDDGSVEMFDDYHSWYLVYSWVR